MRLRIATFNVQNLLSRNRYGPRARPQTAPALSLFDFADPAMRAQIEASVAVAFEDDERQATALAIAETRADLLALQEVENLGVLAPFLANYVHQAADIRYGGLRLLHGNDQRGVDCAFAIRKGIVAGEEAIVARSHAAETFEGLDVFDDALRAFGVGPGDRVFNRDCLEIALDLGDRSLTLFICHFKSMGYGPDGRDATRALREAEARGVRRIVERRFGAGWRDANWIVAGDLNDHRSRILAGGVVEDTRPSGVDALFDDFAVDAAAALPPIARWTCFSAEAAPGGGHVQLDYLLLSPALAAANPAPSVEIVRRGLAYAAPLDPAHPDRSIGYLSTRADRYPRIGWLRPQASDHCPVAATLDIPRDGREARA